jgi:predicted double-glycine peptidase
MLSDPYRAIARLPPNLVPVPVVKQETDFSCGAAAALSVLRFWRDDHYADVDETELHHALQTTNDHGTEPEPIEQYLRTAAHLEARYRNGDVTLDQLLAAVDRGEPPIVDLQAWRDHKDVPWRDTWDAGHYVVLAGYDAERLFVMDPSVLTPGGGYAFFPRAELDERWHDLAGRDNVRVERMTIFVRGAGPRWRPEMQPTEAATRLG